MKTPILQKSIGAAAALVAAVGLFATQSAQAVPLIYNAGLSNSTFSASSNSTQITAVQPTAGLTYNLSNNLLDNLGSVSTLNTSVANTGFNAAKTLDGYIGGETTNPFVSSDATYNLVFGDQNRSVDHLTINLSSASYITLVGFNRGRE